MVRCPGLRLNDKDAILVGGPILEERVVGSRTGFAMVALALLTACSSSTPTTDSTTTDIGPATLAPTSSTTSTPPTTSVPELAESTTTQPAPTEPVSTGWVPAGPGGGGAFAIPGAAANGVVMVPSDLSGIYRSTDGGTSWAALGPEDGLVSTHATAVNVDPRDHNRWLLSIEGGVQLSVDAGETWRTVVDDGYVTDAVFHTTRGWAAWHSAFDSTDGVLLRSDEAGSTWTETQPLPAESRLLAVRPDPHDPDHVMVLTGTGRFGESDEAVFATGDAGATWRTVRVPGLVRDIRADPNISGRWWATTYPSGEGALYVSDDWGNSWEHVVDRTGVLWLARELPDTVRLIDIGQMFPEDPEAGVWRSDDAGASWYLPGSTADWTPGYDESFWGYGGSFDGDVRTIGFTTGNPDEAFWSNSQFVYRTTDGGASWHQIVGERPTDDRWKSTGIDNTVPLVVAASPADPNLVVAGFLDLGCQRSTDAGSSWQSCNPVWATDNWQGWGGNMSAVVHDPDRAGVVWLGLAGDIDDSPMLLLRSDEGAHVDSLVESGAGLPANTTLITDLALDPTSPVDSRTLFAAVDGDVYRSTDDGARWRRVFNCGGCQVLLIDDDLVWAGGSKGLFVSADGGGTWTAAGAAEWSGDATGPWWEWTWFGVADIAPDHSSDGVWVAVTGVGLGLVGPDGSFEVVDNDPLVRSVASDPADPNSLWLGSSSATYAGGFTPDSKGVRHSSDHGLTWTDMNDGLPWPFAIRLEIDVAGGRAWVVNPGRGLHHRTV